MKKLFITGATGFIGSHLYPKLIKLGYDVYTDLRHLHTQKYYCIIHLAAVTHIKTEFDPKMVEANYLLTSEIFKTSARVLYASSCSAAHLTNPYAYTKQWAEYCGMRHHNSIGFRFHNVYGKNNNKGIVWFLMNQPDGADITIRGGELIRDYIYIDDVVNYIIKNIQENDFSELLKAHSFELVPKRRVGIVDVGTGVGTKTIDLVGLYMELSGKNFNITIIPPGDNEPASMISNNVVGHVGLAEGLVKTYSK